MGVDRRAAAARRGLCAPREELKFGQDSAPVRRFRGEEVASPSDTQTDLCASSTRERARPPVADCCDRVRERHHECTHTRVPSRAWPRAGTCLRRADLETTDFDLTRTSRCSTCARRRACLAALVSSRRGPRSLCRHPLRAPAPTPHARGLHREQRRAMLGHGGARARRGRVARGGSAQIRLGAAGLPAPGVLCAEAPPGSRAARGLERSQGPPAHQRRLGRHR